MGTIPTIIVADIRLLNPVHGSGITTILVSGFDCDSTVAYALRLFVWLLACGFQALEQQELLPEVCAESWVWCPWPKLLRFGPPKEAPPPKKNGTLFALNRPYQSFFVFLPEPIGIEGFLY